METKLWQQNLRLLRKAMAITQKQLSETTGVAQEKISRVEKYGAELDASELRSIAQAYGLIMDDFFLVFQEFSKKLLEKLLKEGTVFICNWVEKSAWERFVQTSGSFRGDEKKGRVSQSITLPDDDSFLSREDNMITLKISLPPGLQIELQQNKKEPIALKWEKQKKYYEAVCSLYDLPFVNGLPDIQLKLVL